MVVSSSVFNNAANVAIVVPITQRAGEPALSLAGGCFCSGGVSHAD
ncbi:hypothetical protein [uncultured Fretibacterium sp.]